MAKQKIKINEIEVRIDSTNDYICISDLAKQNSTKTSDVIRNYLKNRANLEFLGLWEQANNDNFNSVHMDAIKNNVWQNSMTIMVSEYVKQTGAIGITTTVGRYGGTYAHPDIAIHFASWISPSFYFYLITEFKRLKEKEQSDWLEEAKFFIDRAEQYNLEGYRFTKDMQKMIDERTDKLKK